MQCLSNSHCNAHPGAVGSNPSHENDILHI